MKHVDVAIIGAGPAGSAAAIALAQRGLTPLLIDRQNFPREKLCGDFINPINRPLLRALGVEPQILARRPMKVAGFRVSAVSGESADASLPDARGDGAGLAMSRALFDHALVGAAANMGVPTRLGCRVGDLESTSAGWKLTLGQNEEWHARILIGADGRNSWTASRLGMNRTAVHGRAVGFQARLCCQSAASDRVEIHLFPGGYAGLVALDDSELNLCLAINRSLLPERDLRRFLLEECLPQSPSLAKLLRRSRAISPLRSAYPVYFPPRRCIAERALLVGDAARVSEPVTGEGIYFALRSGMLAAEILASGFARGDLSKATLRRYQRLCDVQFRRRKAVNALMRFAVYRPALLEPLVGRFARRRRWLNFLVGAVCSPA